MQADYIMVGGFLGAGKTTALLRLADHLTAEGKRVGLITNDQSYGLVDTLRTENAALQEENARLRWQAAYAAQQQAYTGG